MTIRPRIACFHGGGSTAAIYETQCSSLTHYLEGDFEFVFFNAPFTCSAGPGILPAFADQGPYRSWFSQDGNRNERSDGSGYDNSGRDGVDRVWKLMEAAGPGGEWVGAMGFSQGTRVVGGLLLDQQRRERLGDPGITNIKLRFGVCCMGAGAPMESEIARQLDKASRSSERISIPTLHVHGLKDVFLLLGQHQYETHYEERTTSLYEVNYHHAMPWYTRDVEGLVERIRTIEKETRT